MSRSTPRLDPLALCVSAHERAAAERLLGSVPQIGTEHAPDRRSQLAWHKLALAQQSVSEAASVGRVAAFGLLEQALDQCSRFAAHRLAQGHPVRELARHSRDYFKTLLPELVAEADKLGLIEQRGIAQCLKRLERGDGELVGSIIPYSRWELLRTCVRSARLRAALAPELPAVAGVFGERYQRGLEQLLARSAAESAELGRRGLGLRPGIEQFEQLRRAQALEQTLVLSALCLFGPQGNRQTRWFARSGLLYRHQRALAHLGEVSAAVLVVPAAAAWRELLHLSQTTLGMFHHETGLVLLFDEAIEELRNLGPDNLSPILTHELIHALYSPGPAGWRAARPLERLGGLELVFDEAATELMTESVTGSPATPHYRSYTALLHLCAERAQVSAFELAWELLEQRAAGGCLASFIADKLLLEFPRREREQLLRKLAAQARAGWLDPERCTQMMRKRLERASACQNSRRRGPQQPTVVA